MRKQFEIWKVKIEYYIFSLTQPINQVWYLQFDSRYEVYVTIVHMQMCVLHHVKMVALVLETTFAPAQASGLEATVKHVSYPSYENNVNYIVHSGPAILITPIYIVECEHFAIKFWEPQILKISIDSGEL